MNKVLSGRYEIVEKIGSGGMAIVYKAKDNLLGRIVAIKVLREQFDSDEGFVKRFRREAQSAASLSHPNIVSIYDVGKDGSEDYIVMEYVHGKTLKELIKSESPIPHQKAIRIIRQIGEALAHAHANNIIHRDIKPQNILITPEGRAKVTDFGIARAVSSATLTHTGDIVGSVHYLSPEQAKGSHINQQSDIYSLGIILYELVTGKVPYDGDTPITIALKHIQEEPMHPGNIVSGVSKELDAIIMKAIAKSVDDRYKSAEEFLADLNKIETGETIIWDFNQEDRYSTQVHKGMRNQLNEADNKQDVGFDKENTLIKNKKKRNLPILIFTVATILLLVFGGLAYAVKSYLYVPDVVVPDLTGKTLAQARLILEDEGLELGSNIKYEYHDEIEQDRIIEQSIEPEMTVKEGREINVTISKGIEIAKFPDVTTRSPLLENAINTIREAGFEGKITVENRLHPAIEEGRVIEQIPASGAMWSKSSQIKLFVSSGEELSRVTMPDVIGYSSSEARVILQEYKLVVKAEVEKSYEYPINAVISTIPAPGKPVKQGSEVTMVVSSGPGPLP